MVLLIDLQEGLDIWVTNFENFSVPVPSWLWTLVSGATGAMKMITFTQEFLLFAITIMRSSSGSDDIIELIFYSPEEWCILVFITIDDYIELVSGTDKLMHAWIHAVADSQLIVEKVWHHRVTSIEHSQILCTHYALLIVAWQPCLASSWCMAWPAMVQMLSIVFTYMRVRGSESASCGSGMGRLTEWVGSDR